MKRMMAAAVLLLGAGGAVAQPQASPAQQALLRCYLDQLPDLDDGLSDARSIAGALLLRCHQQRRAAIIQGPGMTVDQLMQETREVALDAASVVVLRERVRKKRTP